MRKLFTKTKYLKKIYFDKNNFGFEKSQVTDQNSKEIYLKKLINKSFLSLYVIDEIDIKLLISLAEVYKDL